MRLRRPFSGRRFSSLSMLAGGGLFVMLFGRQPAEGATMRMLLRASAGQRLRPAQSCGLQYSHALASPAAEAISGKWWRLAARMTLRAVLLRCFMLLLTWNFIFGGCGGRAKARAAEDSAALRRRLTRIVINTSCHRAVRRGLASQTRNWSVAIPFIFLFEKKKNVE